MWARESDSAKDRVALDTMTKVGKYKVDTTKATMFGGMEDAYNYYNDDKAVADAIARWKRRSM